MVVAPMKIDFTKMQALGNDFVVIDAVRQRVNLTPELVRKIADRHFGVGCDQLLLVEAPTSSDVDFRYRIFNADGGEVEQCGNGARCFVHFVRRVGLTDKSEIIVETHGGIIRPHIGADGNVVVDMGTPRFAPADLPFVADSVQDRYDLDLGTETITISVVSMGNPHAVQIVDDVEAAPVPEQGPLIESHTRFPQRVNAVYMSIRDPQHIDVRVYERGAGETLACGSGACAAVAVGHKLGLLAAEVTARMHGGELQITWAGDAEPLFMSGPAHTVFDGTIDPEEL